MQNENEAIKSPGTEKIPSDDSTVAEGGEVAGEAANLKPGEAIRPKDTHHILCQEELDRITSYAKGVKMKPWSEDILWLVKELSRAVVMVNEYENRSNIFRQALHKLTNGGFEKLQKEGPLWTEDEDKTLKPEEKDARMMDFLHKQVCCKCGKPPKKAAPPKE